jgi:hypothetical protein
MSAAPAKKTAGARSSRGQDRTSPISSPFPKASLPGAHFSGTKCRKAGDRTKIRNTSLAQSSRSRSIPDCPPALASRERLEFRDRSCSKHKKMHVERLGHPVRFLWLREIGSMPNTKSVDIGEYAEIRDSVLMCLFQAALRNRPNMKKRYRRLQSG